MNLDIENFNLTGFAGPFQLLTKKDCDKILTEDLIPNSKMSWIKGAHEKSKTIRNFSKKNLILEKIIEVLGKDILLWSSCFIKQKPNNTHGWHVDIEHIFWDGITIWCGLKNLNHLTPLSIITHSHSINLTPQELKKKNIDNNNDEEILNYAKKYNQKCELKKLFLNDGEFIMWKGRIWHNTNNFSNKNRHSIILQYTTPKFEVKIPEKYEFPNVKWSTKRPYCYLVSGNDSYNRNLLISKNNDKNNFVDFLKIQIFYKLRNKISLLLKNFK